MNTERKEVYPGGGKVSDILMAPLTQLLSKQDFYTLKSDLFGALMDAYNAGIAAGIEHAEHQAQRQSSPAGKRESFYYPAAATKDKPGTIRFRVSHYVTIPDLDSIHMSGVKELTSDHPDYNLWLWIIYRSYSESGFEQVNSAKLDKLSAEFDRLKEEYARSMVDRKKLLKRIPLRKE